MKNTVVPSKASYDAIAILCGGLRLTEHGYEPTTFDDSDEFGMLGGHVRVMAAVELYRHGVSENFLFSTGISSKQIDKFGPNVPAEAIIYKESFLKQIAQSESLKSMSHMPPLTTFLEDQSVNTVGNLQGILQICTDNNWKNIAIVSSDYHIRRIQALLHLLLKQYPKTTLTFDFLSSENILKHSFPNKYDDEFATAYANPQGKTRLLNEEKGYQDIVQGRYVFSEFQLAGLDRTTSI